MKRLILTSVILALAIVVFNPRWACAEHTAPVANSAVSQSGVRYVGSIAPGRICFTITCNGTRIRELSWTMPRLLAKCSARGSGRAQRQSIVARLRRGRSNRPQRRLQVRILGAGLQREGPDGLERVQDSSMALPSRLRHSALPWSARTAAAPRSRRHKPRPEAGAPEAGATKGPRPRRRTRDERQRHASRSRQRRQIGSTARAATTRIFGQAGDDTLIEVPGNDEAGRRCRDDQSTVRLATTPLPEVPERRPRGGPGSDALAEVPATTPWRKSPATTT